ncbi:hypothetical protein [Agromyces ramosus]|uniref:Cytochrome P450 n=1 Tax=Agromyces ramosus TaxID=33879 RepID=A0ABU0RDM1_9MICO|nr:hypothetical protein [Agromyces ramosus]MDQ0895822.1 cytochrome P450 [Agromyces ramosus]
MTEITDRAEVARILADPRFVVPEADAAATTPFDRFRAHASRFANGAPHDARRGRLDQLAEALRPAELARLAAARTRRFLEAEGTRRVEVAAIARSVPVATLAEALGFSDPPALPPLVATVAHRYASGAPTDAAAEDLAITRLLSAAPSGTDAEARVLAVQLLVQAFTATAALVEGAVRRLEASADASPSSPSTRALLLETLRDDSPVPLTRRVSPNGALVVLRLDGPDREAAAAAAEPRTLAFGAGPRACPAPHLALAIAAAIIDELRRARASEPTTDAPKPATEEAAHAESR